MILLFNVYLTDQPANPYVNLQNWRGNLTYTDKLNVTKYSLASLAVAYPWTKVILNVELGNNYKHHNDELVDYMKATFTNCDVVISTKRCTTQEEWIQLYDELNDDTILYLGNHDHIFVDSGRDTITGLVNKLKEIKQNNPCIVISHWPENIRCAKSGYIELHESQPRYLNEEYNVHDTHISYKSTCIDSMLIITKSLYKQWFIDNKWIPSTILPRTDGVGGDSLLTISNQIGVPLPKQTMMIPYKELFRHFDGYMHQRITNNICPALEIPKGFFESEIRIRYGYDDYKPGWTNINPMKTNYFAYEKDGTDYKITLEDLPLVWQDKVVDIDINPYIDEGGVISCRLQSILDMVYSDDRYSPYVEENVVQNVLNTYMLNYKKYKLDI